MKRKIWKDGVQIVFEPLGLSDIKVSPMEWDFNFPAPECTLREMPNGDVEVIRHFTIPDNVSINRGGIGMFPDFTVAASEASRQVAWYVNRNKGNPKRDGFLENYGKPVIA